MKAMLNICTIIFALVSLIVSVFGADSSGLGYTNECELVSLLGPVSEMTSACSEALATTYTSTLILTTTTIEYATGTVTSTSMENISIVSTDTVNVSITSTTTTATNVTQTITTTEVITTSTTDILTSSSTIMVTDNVTISTTSTSTSISYTTSTISSAAAKKKRGVSVKDKTFSVSETIDIIIIPTRTAIPGATGILVDVSHGTASMLVGNGDKVEYDIAIPTVVSNMMDDSSVSVKVSEGQIQGASYELIQISVNFDMNLVDFCTCLASANVVTTTSYSTVTSTQMSIVATTTRSATSTIITKVVTTIYETIQESATETQTDTVASTNMESTTSIITSNTTTTDILTVTTTWKTTTTSVTSTTVTSVVPVNCSNQVANGDFTEGDNDWNILASDVAYSSTSCNSDTITSCMVFNCTIATCDNTAFIEQAIELVAGQNYLFGYSYRTTYNFSEWDKTEEGFEMTMEDTDTGSNAAAIAKAGMTVYDKVYKKFVAQNESYQAIFDVFGEVPDDGVVYVTDVFLTCV